MTVCVALCGSLYCDKGPINVVCPKGELTVSFASALKNDEWVEIHESVMYRKGPWELTFDTSSWIEVGTAGNPRVFDVPVPEPRLEQWCVKLIGHLCMMEDERFRLRQALERVAKDNPSTISGSGIAQNALSSCYHTWLVRSKLPETESTMYYCVVCGSQKSGFGS